MKSIKKKILMIPIVVILICIITFISNNSFAASIVTEVTSPLTGEKLTVSADEMCEIFEDLGIYAGYYADSENKERVLQNISELSEEQIIILSTYSECMKDPDFAKSLTEVEMVATGGHDLDDIYKENPNYFLDIAEHAETVLKNKHPELNTSNNSSSGSTTSGSTTSSGNGTTSTGSNKASFPVKNDITNKHIVVSPIELYNIINEITADPVINGTSVPSLLPSLGTTGLQSSNIAVKKLNDRKVAILANYDIIMNNNLFVRVLKELIAEKNNDKVNQFVNSPLNPTRESILTQANLEYTTRVLKAKQNETTGSSTSGTTTGSGSTGGSTSGTTTGSGSTGGSTSGATTGSGSTGGSTSGTTTGSGSTGGSTSGTTTGSGTTGSTSGTSSSSSSESESEEGKFTVSGVVIRPGNTEIDGEEITNPADNPDAYKPGEMGDNDTLIRIGGIIVGALKIIGIITAVVILVILGIKYLTRTIQEKAEYKKTMIPYIIRAFFLGAGGIIIEVIFNVLTNITY